MSRSEQSTGGAPSGGGTGGGTTRRRRTAAGLAVLAGLLVVALVLFFTTRGDSAGDRSTAAGASGAAASSSATPATTSAIPSGSGAGSTDLPPALHPVRLSATASESDGVVASLPQIESIPGQGTGPGNVSGPAVRVTVRVLNGTSNPISLTGVAVNMYYGDHRSPASPLDDPSQNPFHDSLNPGASADGVYVFSVPTAGQRAVTVEVGYRAGAPLLLFTGAVR